ncbi:Organic hydroperoxide resistance protein [Paenibacillus pasadenensis]|uniref:Organic hydroperoxide resistance protein n=1 Tax=Paenibacillus pasadenensis TaxID=217090 RepID=A0A2N5N6U6_9BACL|nr:MULTISPECIES: organic hydroperoxide resistance protein [Paenibacillus]PLT46058.1 Organic hydroperoxide resistance protein [Paenibacillus pasadenensis]QGG56536.1 Ohr family peroxiredoxin [Paenibacillus sp. B01]
MEALYTTEVRAKGGRGGKVSSTDGVLELPLAIPKGLGGPGGEATNPEQLFAAGYAACFEGALQLAARQGGIDAKEAIVTAQVSIFKDEPSFKLGAKLQIYVPDADPARVRELAEQAHRFCPYSKATRGNIDVELEVLQAAPSL